MFSRVRRVGFTVLESVIASFLLLTAIALTVLLVDTTLQSQANNERRLAAVRSAENALEEIRAQAAIDFEAMMTQLDGGSWPSTDSSVTLSTRVEQHKIVVPNSSLETEYPPTATLPGVGKKILRNSVLKVELEARYGEHRGDTIALIGYVIDSRPNDFSISITPRSGYTAAHNGVLEFGAVALDSNGEPITDLFFTWYVEPVSSYGTINSVSRDGQDCVYKNSYEDYSGQFVSTPGYCTLVVRAVYKGREATHAVSITNN